MIWYGTRRVATERHKVDFWSILASSAQNLPAHTRMHTNTRMPTSAQVHAHVCTHARWPQTHACTPHAHMRTAHTCAHTTHMHAHHTHICAQLMLYHSFEIYEMATRFFGYNRKIQWVPSKTIEQSFTIPFSYHWYAHDYFLRLNYILSCHP